MLGFPALIHFSRASHKFYGCKNRECVVQSGRLQIKFTPPKPLSRETRLISIIIPTYNDNNALKDCLQAIADSDTQPAEVIVVDDASTPPARAIVESCGYRYVRLDTNSGQATARNIGAEIASGELLLFIDSDVVIRRDTLQKIECAYHNRDIAVYQGLASTTPVNKGFGPKLMALKWYYMLQNTREASYVHSHIFSIRKSVFAEIGGFDGRFRPPGGGEEFELGHRLRKKHIIHTDPDLLVEHNFPGVLARTKALFHRTYVWASLFAQSGKFEKTNASLGEAMAGVSSVGAILSLLLSPLHSSFLPAAIGFFFCHAIINRGFYRFIARETGTLFMLRAVLPNMLWSLAQMAAAGCYYARRITGSPR